MVTHSHVLAWRMLPIGPLNKLGPLPISPVKFRLISYIFKEGFLIQQVRSSYFAHTQTHTSSPLQRLLYFRLIVMFVCVLQPASKIAPDDPHLLGGAPLRGPLSHCSRVDLCDKQNTTEVTYETWFSKTVDSMWVSLSDSHHLLQGDAPS